MFSDISVLSFLIYAAGVGFAAAIIYTNIQRTALSKFINYLVDNGCDNEQTAVSLDTVGLSRVQKNVIKSAVKHQHGFKRSVVCISDNKSSSKNEEEFFNRVDDSKYFLSEKDTDTLKKKYSYKTMPTRLVVLFVAVLAVVVIVTSAFVNWLIDAITIPKTDTNNNKESEQSEPAVEESTNEDSALSEDAAPDSSTESTDDNNTAGPRIPI